MSPTDMRNADDHIYNEDKEVKRVLHKLVEHVGLMQGDLTEIRTALKGNDFGTDGLVNRVEMLEKELIEVRSDVEMLKRQAKLHRRIMKFAYSAGGALALWLIKYFGDKFYPSK